MLRRCLPCIPGRKRRPSRLAASSSRKASVQPVQPSRDGVEMSTGGKEYIDALFRLGNSYESGTDGMPRDPKKAFECFLRAATKKHPKALLRVGFYYDVGLGTNQDPLKAVDYYRLAAKTEPPEPRAQFSLALCYSKGVGVDKDPAVALEWFKKAAENGYNRALYNLGYCYELGVGTDADMKVAMEYYKSAAKRGNTYAIKRLAFFGEQVEVSASEAG